MANTQKQRRGLANASPETRQRVARSGGSAIAQKHQGDSYYHDIGSLGGQSTAEKMHNTDFYQQIGHAGGKARQRQGKHIG